MRNIKICIVLLVALGMIFQSCTPSLEIDLSSVRSSGEIIEKTSESIAINFTSEAGTASFSFESNKKWTAEAVNDRASDWLLFSPSSGGKGGGTINVNVSANSDYEERTGVIELKCGNVLRSIKVTQKQKDAVILSSGRVEIGSDGDAFQIEVKHNIAYSVQVEKGAAEWIHQTNPKTKGLTSDMLRFEVTQNFDLNKREGKILISSSAGSEIVTVYQAGESPSIILSDNEEAVSDKGGMVSIVVTSNVDVAFSVSGSWVHAVETKTMSTDTYQFTVDANPGYEPRYAEILFTNTEHNLSEKVIISQMQKDALVVAKTRYDISNDGGGINIEVGHNVPYFIYSDVEWIRQEQTKAFENDKLYFVVSPNDTYDDREGVITFANEDKTIVQKVKVYQTKTDAIIISQKVYTVSDKGGTIDIELQSNVDFTVHTTEDWLRQIETKSLSNKTLHFEIDANEEYESRCAEIMIRNIDSGLEERVLVAQVSKGALVIAKDAYHVSEHAEIIDVEVNYTVDFTVSISVDWIDLFMTKALNTSVYSFRIEPNIDPYSTTTDRIGEIGFYSLDQSLNQKVTVIQDGSMPIFEVGNSEFTVPAEGGSFEVPVTHSRDISVDITDADWLHLIEAKKADTDALCFSADENKVYGERVGHAVIKCGDCSATLTFTQKSGISENIVLFTEPEKLDYPSTSSTELAFFSPSDWTITVRDSEYFTVSESSGKKGEQTVTVTALHGNGGNGIRSTVLTIASGDKTLEVPVSQIQVFEVNPTEYHISGKGGDITYSFDFLGADFSNVHVDYDDAYYEMITQKDLPSNTVDAFDFSSMNAYSNSFNWHWHHTIYPNYSEETRIGKLRLTYEENGEQFESVWITVIQDPGEYSHDYCDDGLTYSLQTHKLGNKGVPIVIMGDGFIDTDIKSGKYDEAMALAYKYLFSVEPMASLKDLFDVYVVKAVSPIREFTGNTRFQSTLNGNVISGNSSRAIEYAMKASEDIRQNDLLVLVILNDTRYAGTAHMSVTTLRDDIPDGWSVAYISMSDENPASGSGFEPLLHHEAIGHGFGKLGDEYAYSVNGAIPYSEVSRLLEIQSYGCHRNIDIHPNVEDTYWASLAANPQFSKEHLGTYEGAYTYWTGVYRPTENSIMNQNICGFNAPSREMIYKRAMKIAYGSSWKYNENDFLDFDASCMASKSFEAYSPGRDAGAKVGSGVLAPKADFVPLPPPVVILEK